MKKNLLIIIFSMLLGVSFVNIGLAQGIDAGSEKQVFLNKLALAKSMNFEGTVLSHDVLCRCIVLRTDKGELTLQDDYAKFMDEYDRAKGLKIGTKIKGDYKTVDHINYAIDLFYSNEK